MIQRISYNPCVSNQINFGAKRVITKLPDEVKKAGKEVFDSFITSATDKHNAEKLTYIDKEVIPELRQNRNLFGQALVEKLNLKSGKENIVAVIEKNPKLSGSDFVNGLKEALGDFIL